MYGHTWSSQQGTEPNDTWIRACAGISNQQLGHGLQQVLNQGGKWPPTLPEFKALCQGEWESQRLHKAYDPNVAIVDKSDVALLENKLAPMTADEARAEMKKTMGIS